MGPKSKSAAANPFRHVLDPIEARLDALDAAIRDIHPDYSNRILDRMTELEETCREHAHRVMRCIDNQKKDLVESADRVSNHVEIAVCDLERRTAKAIERFEEVTQRHQTDAKALRCELGELKTIIDSSSEHLAKEREQCERILEDARQILSGLEDKVEVPENIEYRNIAKERLHCEQVLADARHLLSNMNINHRMPVSQHSEVETDDFRAAQRILMSQARFATSDVMAHVIRRAQSTAASRSPSRRASRETSPARSVISDHAADMNYSAGAVRGRVASCHFAERSYRGRSSHTEFFDSAPTNVMSVAHTQYDNTDTVSQPTLMMGIRYTPEGLHLPPVIPSVQATGSVMSVHEHCFNPQQEPSDSLGH